MLEWWADCQFGKVEGQEVKAIRLFCAKTLPELAEAWCEKVRSRVCFWDPGLFLRFSNPGVFFADPRKSQDESKYKIRGEFDCRMVVDVP